MPHSPRSFRPGFETYALLKNGAQTTYALWAVVAPRLAARPRHWSTPAAEFCILVVPLVLALTVLSSHPLLLNAVVSALALFSHQTAARTKSDFPPLGTPTTPSFPKDAQPRTSANRLFAKPFVTVYRAHMMLMTIICILAVDFSVFPREFAKAETRGTSIVSSSAIHHLEDTR